MRHPLNELTCAVRRRRVFPLLGIFAGAIIFSLWAGVSPAATDDAAAKPSPLLPAMKTELDRSMKALGAQDPGAYFIGYALTETQRATVTGSNGALLTSDEGRNRWLQVSVRTGSYQLDDTHKVDGREPPNGGPGISAPVDDDPEVLRRAIWLETDKQYRAAAEALIKIQTSKEVKAQSEEGKAPDFSREKPQTSIGPWASFQLERKPWEVKVRDYTKYFRDSRGGDQFHRDVYGAGSEYAAIELRRHRTAIWPGTFPAGFIHSRQSRRTEWTLIAITVLIG